MTTQTTKPTPAEIEEAIEFGVVQVHIGTHRIVTRDQLNMLEDSNYYHLGCTLDAEALTEDDEIQALGNIQFDIVDTAQYAGFKAIHRAVDSDGCVNGDDLALWRMLDKVYADSADDFDIQNAILGGKIALLNTFEVDKDYRRIGAGTSMLNHLKTYLEFLDVHGIALIPSPLGVDTVEVTWKAKRDDLLSFYATNGFKIIPVDDEFIALYTF